MSRNANNTLKDIIKQVKSEKITERQQGLQAVRELFSQNHVVAKFHISNGQPNPKAWLIVFQGLFEAVLNEKMAFLKVVGKAATTTATARRRLTDAANTVRWLTERTAQYLNNPVAQALLDHLYRTMMHKNDLLEPVALDYIKALRHLLEWTPHLDRLDVNRWVGIVEMAFNVVLGDPIKNSFCNDPAESCASPAPVPMEVDDSEFFLENDDESDASSMTSPSKKRRRRGGTAAPAPSSLRSPSKPRRNKIPSKEQNELVPILFLLLRSSSAPLLLQDVAYLPSSILLRLQRFLEIYPADASLYYDYLLTLISTLSHLSLNRKDSVVRFAQGSWDLLVSLWGTKNKAMKECLVAVLRVLFPFLTAHGKSRATSYDWSMGIAQLWRLLDGEAESRWGVDGLSLECLRLELADPEDGDSCAFVARTFRAGYNFDTTQALAWAILELQADCAEKLFQHSESIHSQPAPSTRNSNKRTRVENPISSLLDSMQQQGQSHVRAYHLQILLFFIDRHWPVLHDTLQQTVFSTLIQFISFDGPLVQSWTFLCFAAIAHCDTHPRVVSGDDSPVERDWDTIWTHAIRRTNVPDVSRAACQAAYVLLLHSHSHSHSSSRLALTPQRLLLEIESLAKDLDVQGPPFPYDSVCVFLSQALRVASQDVRLYRMQFEEKALSWVVDCWKVPHVGNMPLYMVGDVLQLLETICGFSKRSDLFCRVNLPECLIVETLVEQGKTKVIRDYLLTATLPEFRQAAHRPSAKAVELPSTAAEHRRVGDDPLDEGPRERKISVFLLRSLEALASDLEILSSTTTHPTAEKARKSLDWVVTALSFESLLNLNGIRPNRRVIQAACKLMLLVAPLLKDPRWPDSEKALVLLAFEPLTSTGQIEDDDVFTTALLPPDVGSGIKAETLQSLTSGRGRKEDVIARRLDLQRLICKSADVQDGFEAVTKILRDVLRILVGGQSSNDVHVHAPDVDFETPSSEHATDTRKPAAANSSVRCIAEVSIAFLAVIPILQSVSGEPTSDKELTELVLSCAEDPNETSLLIYRIFLSHVRQKTLALSKNNFDALLDHLAPYLLKSYQHARSEIGQMTALHFLDSTLHIWSVATGERAEHVRSVCAWVPKALKAGQEIRTHIRSWKVRDAVARFYDRYLVQDPGQTAWYDADEDDEERAEDLPNEVLPAMNRDDDIRVRFRAAVLCSHLFAVGRSTGLDAATVYGPIFESYPRDLEHYENMLTRLLSLGNMMIVSSAVRRGAYWHLLEGSLHTTQYSLHTEAILRGVSQRLGMSRFAVLFEAYASQLAFTIKIRDKDFLRFPPRLLGYNDRKECAEANFLAFTPTNLIAEHDHQTTHVGRKLFEGHCKVIQKPVSEGIRDCFADIIGYQILQALLSMGQMSTDDLKCLLLEKTMTEENPTEFHSALGDNVDAIVSWIVRTLGDQDFRSEGPIAAALEAVDPSGKTGTVFRALVRHRNLEDFETHAPNVPSFPSSTVLEAVSWFDALVPDTDVKATAYHVTHELFAAIQRSPLVNEQFRLINALCLWIAFRHESFQDHTLLHALIRGATSLMAQSDLARAAQSMLEWVFDCYHTSEVHNPGLPDVLIRICCFANDYARKSPTSPLHALGQDLRAWIDAQVLILSTVKSKPLKASLARALSAWPHTPSPRLAELFSSITATDLSTVLSDPSIVSNKFRLVRQLLNHARAEDRDAAKFAETDFWRLRECIPSSEQLQDEDIDAFAGLLLIHEGRLSSFGSEQPSVLGKHRDASSGALPQHWIVQVLLNMLEASDASQVHVAYQTLRSVMSVSAPNVATHLPHSYRDELVYLQAYKRTPKTRPARQLEELLSSDVYLDIVGDFPQWVGMIATLLSDILSTAEPFYAQLTLILQSDAAFTEETLPFLVHTLLESERKVVTDKTQPLSALLHRKTLSNYFTAVLESGNASIACVRSIVDIVLHLRHFAPRAEKVDALAYDKWLAIDYTLLARNSIGCGAYTTSLLFLELAAEYATRDEGAAEKILYEIYSHIDEPDGFYGIKTQDLHQFLIKRFHHEKQWEKAFRFHSAALEAGSTETAEADGLLQSFHSFGFNHLAIDTLQSSSFGAGTTFNSPGMNYRLGWRTETWDLPERKGEGNPGAPLYNALRAVYRERNPHVIQFIVRDAVCEEMGRLRVLGSENLAEIRDAAQNLMCLNQVAQWFQTNTQTRLTSRQVEMSQWSEFINLGKGFDFADFENVMATRISLVRSVRRKEERQQIGTMVSPFAQCLLDVEKQCLIRLSQAARDAQQVQIALNSIVRAQRLEQLPSFDVSEEFASVLRLHSEEKLAVQFLKALDLTHLPHSEKAVILARLGTWMAEARLENPTDISSRYFEPAASYINSFRAHNSTEFTASHAKVYHQYAIFAEHQYKAINNSPDSIRWRLYVERKTQEVKLRRSQGGYSEKVITDAEKLLKEDLESYRKHNSARETFLAHAIEMYSRALETSDAFDGDGAIRLCSLWFENFNQTECGFQENVRTALDRIPSRKLVFLAHQLSARLAKTDEPSQQTLERVVLRMCMDHPFHSLYQVYCLMPHEQQPTNRRQSSRHGSPGTQTTARTEAATEIFDRLRGDAKHEKRIKDVELVAGACLGWAKFKICNTDRDPKNRRGLSKVQPIPAELAIRKIAGVSVPVLTDHTPLDPSCNYSRCVFIDRFETTFETCGGINLPKVCVCVGSDGARFKQLFKGEGNDDLRQDAVMAQVFELCNIVLKGDRETARRSLGVRSYRIIPLGLQAGVLEFVANTTPLQIWLTPAHTLYNKTDWPPPVATTKYNKQWQATNEPAKKLVLYQEVKKHFHPVLRHFFTEKHKTPMAWFAMRLNYIRSVATTSIVGHVLGLGDRHGSNILLDSETGEMVHIDLGIAFDQGKLLKVPELVPFRMTADVVDGMGAAGTQGVFQRCAEETLRVLRAGSEVIMTVLEVFKHDPLHSWTASEIKIKRVQGDADTAGAVVKQGPTGIGIDMASGTADEAADRALTSVARKLDKAMSVEYTVNELLAQATDPMRLATIYSGWGAIY
ncbi:hypothetical protein B0H17DRAFT_1213256 [Mycena rosella]|uniref:Serine/threonine-protein kinase Tel1 n=1 Tax=Mycena rosella TaxID=1033263 RepID=A0AAD7CQH4_MYCRO|nr:hypothetical protein B0H17DRAFT_1213256 [Mycena rosella]